MFLKTEQKISFPNILKSFVQVMEYVTNDGTMTFVIAVISDKSNVYTKISSIYKEAGRITKLQSDHWRAFTPK